MSENAERILRDLALIKRTLDSLTPAVVHDLVRRSKYRAATDQAGERAHVKGAVSDPTLSAVVRIMSGQNIADPIFDNVRDIARTIADLADLCVKIEDKRRFIYDTADKAGVKSTIAYCECCGREVSCTKTDRLRSGYCSADYTAWLRAGKPYRAQFEQNQRAKTLANTGETKKTVSV